MQSEIYRKPFHLILTLIREYRLTSNPEDYFLQAFLLTEPPNSVSAVHYLEAVQLT
jgi:hypothetical protein